MLPVRRVTSWKAGERRSLWPNELQNGIMTLARQRPKASRSYARQGLSVPGAGEQGRGRAVSWWQGAQCTWSRWGAGRQLSLRKRLQGGPFSNAEPMVNLRRQLPASRALCLDVYGARCTGEAAERQN